MYGMFIDVFSKMRDRFGFLAKRRRESRERGERGEEEVTGSKGERGEFSPTNFVSLENLKLVLVP